jgi:ferredoxin
MRLTELEKAWRPLQARLQRQEIFRRQLGVRNVSHPTYERYITGPVERFDSRKNAFAAMMTDNPHGKEFRQKYQDRTGVDWFSKPLPQEELEPEDRPAQALAKAGWRLCTDYHPEPMDLTPPGGRFDFNDPARMSRLVKKAGLYFGAEMVRIARLDQRWVYADKNVPHKYAIVCVVPHDRAFNDTTPSHLSGAAVGRTYSRLKFITTQLTDFIRSLGYDAAYRETLGWNPEMLMVPIAIDAGVGEFSRNARVLSPEFGTNMRLKAVTTDMPLMPDPPISFGVHEFCMVCENCAEYCPAGANPKGEPTEAPDSMFNNPGFKKWYVRADKCLYFWMADRKKWITCGGRCIAYCPWNKPQNIFHNVVRWLAVNGPGKMKKILVWGDRIAYGRTKSINANRKKGAVGR